MISIKDFANYTWLVRCIDNEIKGIDRFQISTFFQINVLVITIVSTNLVVKAVVDAVKSR